MSYPGGGRLSQLFETPGKSLWARVNEPTYDITAFLVERVCWMLGGFLLMLVASTFLLDKPHEINPKCQQTVTDTTIVLVCGRKG
jgi:hypothetical protein